MVDSSSNKKTLIPFSDIQHYLEEHEDLIVSYVKLEKRGAISREELQVKFAQSLLRMQESISNLLEKSNNQDQLDEIKVKDL